MKAESEYERLAMEILQDQHLRVTLFTFSVTTVAAILGVGLSFGTTSTLTASGLSMGIVAAYVVVIPSVILVCHYSRGINCKSEFLNVAHKEHWMACFDRLSESAIPGDHKLTKTHRILVMMGAYSSENSFRLAYTLLNVLVSTFAVVVSLQRGFGVRILGLYGALFLVTQLVMRAFRPISEREYRALWREILVGDTSTEVPPNPPLQPTSGAGTTG
jgi:hypothetical protein